jgi:hypothetical protein
MFRQQIARQARLFSTTPVTRKSPVEAIKDAAKAVDKTISGAAVKGIEKGGTYIIHLSQALFAIHCLMLSVLY